MWTHLKIYKPVERVCIAQQLPLLLKILIFIRMYKNTEHFIYICVISTQIVLSKPAVFRLLISAESLALNLNFRGTPERGNLNHFGAK
jgi:hypothetical protein